MVRGRRMDENPDAVHSQSAVCGRRETSGKRLANRGAAGSEHTVRGRRMDENPDAVHSQSAVYGRRETSGK